MRIYSIQYFFVDIRFIADVYEQLSTKHVDSESVILKSKNWGERENTNNKNYCRRGIGRRMFAKDVLIVMNFLHFLRPLGTVDFFPSFH